MIIYLQCHLTSKLSRFVQQCGARVCCYANQDSPRCTKRNGSPIYNQCTDLIICYMVGGRRMNRLFAGDFWRACTKYCHHSLNGGNCNSHRTQEVCWSVLGFSVQEVKSGIINPISLKELIRLCGTDRSRNSTTGTVIPTSLRRSVELWCVSRSKKSKVGIIDPISLKELIRLCGCGSERREL